MALTYRGGYVTVKVHISAHTSALKRSPTSRIGRTTQYCLRVSFDPYAPYGSLVESAVRVVTWNVWGRYGSEWEARQAALEDTLAAARPDVICLVEAWRHGGSSQPERIAARLNLPYHHFVGDWQQEDWVSGVGLVSRWPMSEPRRRSLQSEEGTGTGQAVHVAVDGERGPIHLFATMLDFPLHASGIRQGQVKGNLTAEVERSLALCDGLYCSFEPQGMG
jgi:hypothetical protein